MKPLAAAAPAKANLALHVAGRRPDGYHDLSMLVASASLADEVEVAEAAALSLEVEGPPDVPRDGTNLVARAARALAARAGVEPRARIRLAKRVPAGAGLGGGSSNAAAALRLLRDLWRLDLDDAALADVGRGIGADVPACLALAGGGAAVVEGIGDRVAPFRPGAPLEVVILHPGEGLSTAAVYGAHRSSSADRPGRDRPGRDRRADVAALRAAWAAGDLAALARGAFNDLTPAALSLRPALARLPEALAAAGCPAAVMTGSGAAWLGLCPSGGAEEVAARLRRAPPPAPAGFLVTAARLPV